MCKKFYPVDIESATFENAVKVWVPLKVARALKQTEADAYRLDDHRKQLPVKWERRHSDRKVTWWGFVEDKLLVKLEDRV